MAPRRSALLASCLDAVVAGCISGKANIIPATASFVSGTPGRFGLRANGVEILQFVTGGVQGELSFTSRASTPEADNAEPEIDRSPYMTCGASRTIRGLGG
jgi:hypothetical protein